MDVDRDKFHSKLIRLYLLKKREVVPLKIHGTLI